MTDVLHHGAADVAAEHVTTHEEVTPRDLDITRGSWRLTHLRGVQVTDLAVLAVAVGIAQVVKFGLSPSTLASGPFHLSYPVVGVSIAIMWWFVLGAFGSRDIRTLGYDSEEYRKVTRATVLMFGWLAIVSLLFKWDMSRAYLLTAFPVGLVLLLTSRKLWRVWLRSGSRKGKNVNKVLIVGGIRSAQELCLKFDTAPKLGQRVTGVWVPDRSSNLNEWLDVPGRFIPVMGHDRSLAGALTVSDATTVIVTDTEHLGSEGIRELTWQLEGVDVDLMVSPNVLDVAGSRMTLRDVARVPFIHVQEPQYAEAGAWPKVLFDKIGASLILLAASPLMIGTALAVKLSSKGPIFYRQQRIGLNGQQFGMIKFRSMKVDADSELAALLEQQGGSDKPLFKIIDDPRVTKVGKFIRRYSIDELPQLLNVVKGEMSLVGPRPQREEEVALYDDKAHRRLHVRPGMTGLWQVSGRSDLEWEEAIRLDTYYVENWSLTGDVIILWRTVRAVLGSDGAY